MLFRTEDSFCDEESLVFQNREFLQQIDFSNYELNKTIADLVRAEVNCSQGRKLISFSASLAACLLKYNQYATGPLHIYYNMMYDNILIEVQNQDMVLPYSIVNRYYPNDRFIFEGKIKSFVIDIANNEALNSYLKNHTGVGKKARANPQKDGEVVVLNPSPNRNSVLETYVSALYILYALQYRYGFISNPLYVNRLIERIVALDQGRFINCPQEQTVICSMVLYLSYYWQYESKVSKEIIEYTNKNYCTPVFYPNGQFYEIINPEFSFDELWNDRSDIEDVVTATIWKTCREFLIENSSN